MKNHNDSSKQLSRRLFFRKFASIATGTYFCGHGLLGRGVFAEPGNRHAVSERNPFPLNHREDIVQPTENRVVWVHDRDATSWNGSTGHYRDYVDQSRVNAIVESGVKELTGQSDTVSAWQQIIPDYSAGKKIAIKVNINNSGDGIDIDALPHPVNAVIAGLKSAGVLESDIWVIEPSRKFPTSIGNPITDLYPGVDIWDISWGNYYDASYNSSDPSLTISHGLHPALSDSKLPDQLGEASYLINIPILKGHPGGAEITLAFKNNFGLFAGGTISKFHEFCYPSSGNYDYHDNPLTDIYKNTNIKDKCVLTVGDALFAHRKSNTGRPEVWDTFGGEFPNSLFFSSDPVAIDSVMWDFSNAEHTKEPDGQLYLHRAMELGLGTHEHWNNPVDRQYSLIDFRQLDLST